MLTVVSATNVNYGTLLLPLADSSGGYSVQDIEGLGPVKAILTASTLAQEDGAKLHNARRDPRNIVLTLGIESDWVTNTVAGLRRNLYRFFSPKSSLNFALYEDDVPWGSIDMVVESCEPVLFSADPQITISLLGYGVDFLAPDMTDIDSFTVDDTTTQTITYEGTSDTGFTFSLTFLENATSITLVNVRPDGLTQTIELDGTFTTGDVLEINTVNGNRSIVRRVAGFPSNILNYLDARSDFIQFQPGDNQFRVFYNGTTTPFNLQYTAKFEGY